MVESRRSDGPSGVGPELRVPIGAVYCETIPRRPTLTGSPVRLQSTNLARSCREFGVSTLDAQATLQSNGLSAADGPRHSIVLYHGARVEVVPLKPEQAVIVGRTKPSDIAIPAGTLSRQHARFSIESGAVWIEDLGSTNGTWVNGDRVERCLITPQDKISLGELEVGLHVLPSERVESHESFLSTVETEVLRALSSKREVALLLLEGPTPSSEWVERIRTELGPNDRLSRFGPSTLEILLPGSGLESATKLAERISRLAVRPETPPFAGVAVCPDCAGSAEALLEAARAASLSSGGERRLVVAPSRASTQLEGQSPDFVIRSESMKTLFQTVDKLASATIPVLILGETGSGKELVARALHDRGPRASRPMRCVNCAAIPAQLLEGVLFGHEKGAFTGASARSSGVFEASLGGTVFLDEIGELPPAAQAALLRVLETRRVTRIGGHEEIVVDVRVVAATHRDLEAMVRLGQFREDLLFRLNAVTLRVPPLRERTVEILPLARHFMVHRDTQTKVIDRISPDAEALLLRYSWPGNVRELKNVIDRAGVLAETSIINVADLPERLTVTTESKSASGVLSRARSETDTEARAGELDFKSRMERIEVAFLARALEAHGYRRADAAKSLGVPVRTLAHKIATQGLSKDGPDSSRRAENDRWIEELHSAVGAPVEGEELRSTLTRYEVWLIRSALDAARGNKSEAARVLRIPLRTLVEKIRVYGLGQ